MTGEPIPAVAKDQCGGQASITETWQAAVELLGHLLSEQGVVSSRALRKEFERRGIDDARSMVLRLKFFDFDGEPDPLFPRPPYRFYYRGYSFYSKDEFRKAEAETEAAAESAGVQEQEGVQEAPEAEVRVNRQEEARLVTYVKTSVETLYATDHGPDAEIAFDVHNQRPGTDFENVDVIAIYWRSNEVVDIVSVEAKLDFTSKLVQQANNYRRFSNRVWIAVPVQADLTEAASELRDSDPSLFEYVIETGIGILACRRARGRAYEVAPVQWPRHITVDPVERDGFIQRYRSAFEDAKIVAPSVRSSYPRLG